MSEFNADAIIAEAVANDTANNQATASTEAKPADTANPVAKATPEQESQELAAKPDSELTPEQLQRRIANRQSHLNSKLAKMRRENREMKAALASQNTQAQPANQGTAKTPANDGRPVKPKEEDFDGKTWGEYQEALDKYTEDLTDWKLEQKLAAKQADTNKGAPAQIDPVVVQRIDAIANQEAEFVAQNPEYAALYEQHADFMGSLPLPIAQALMTADNASLALFALMKEGKLEDLEDMSDVQIFREVAQAEVRGAAYVKQGGAAASQQNNATNAPRPLKAAKGTASAEKDLSDKSVEELMEQFNKR